MFFLVAQIRPYGTELSGEVKINLSTKTNNQSYLGRQWLRFICTRK
jgi:hypothetical protein